MLNIASLLLMFLGVESWNYWFRPNSILFRFLQEREFEFISAKPWNILITFLYALILWTQIAGLDLQTMQSWNQNMLALKF